MSLSVWIRTFWQDPRTQAVLRQVIVALLLALLSVLGYDRTVAVPRVEAQLGALEMRVSGCQLLAQ